jgi:hypothetical protein
MRFCAYLDLKCSTEPKKKKNWNGSREGTGNTHFVLSALRSMLRLLYLCPFLLCLSEHRTAAARELNNAPLP